MTHDTSDSRDPGGRGDSSARRRIVLAVLLMLFAGLTHAAVIASVSGSTVTLSAGKADGVRVGMTALVRGVVTVEGRATEVEFAKIEVTAVEEHSCTAKVLRVLPTANALAVSEGQSVVFQQTLVPPSGKPAGEPVPSEALRPPTPSKDPYSGLSPLELSSKADAAYSAGRYEEAEKLYAALLRAVPDDPLSSKRLRELTSRKAQADAEARKKSEKSEKLKNADYFLTRGDDAYKTGDYALAASYYGKVAEVDESYRDAGGKCWLSKARAASAKGDTGTLGEAKSKLRDLTLPESLKADLASLGPSLGEVRTHSKDGLEYVFIPAGTFQMGEAPGDPPGGDASRPRHAVTISKDFWMGKTEVTAGAYKRFCSATGRAMQPPPSFNANWQREDLPMVNVTWEDARAYCEWAGGRLPTEAEWEYAARAGTQTPYYWGSVLEGAYAWYVVNSEKSPHPVGQKRANPWGLYDVVGNVWEWCSDWCEDSYYARSPATDPTGPANGQRRIVRGGSYLESTNLHLSARGRMPAAAPLENIGFRCLRAAAPLIGLAGQPEPPLPPPVVMKPVDVSAILGRYVSDRVPDEYIEFKGDRTFALRYQGDTIRGKFTLQDNLVLEARRFKGGSSEAAVFSETMIYWGGVVWIRQPSP